MYDLTLLFHLLIALVLIALILLQRGKGSDIGASFGAGASQTVFGSAGSGSFLMKLTGVLAAAFYITSLSLGYMTSQQVKSAQQINAPIQQQQQQKAPTSLPMPSSTVPVKSKN